MFQGRREGGEARTLAKMIFLVWGCGKGTWVSFLGPSGCLIKCSAYAPLLARLSPTPQPPSCGGVWAVRRDAVLKGDRRAWQA